tara:strand:+ start:383 stop:760 length:378 start_codon:yes stop_codon:yes gene_type:complete
MANKKYDKRRALFCKLLGESKSYKGYYKYLVTIGEKDGTIHKQPVYGRDMQSALNRLINKELTYKVEKKLETNTGWVFLLWLAVMVTPAFLADYNSPWFLLYVFGSVVVLASIAVWWYSYVNRGE